MKVRHCPSTTVSPGRGHYGAEGRPGGQEDWQESGTSSQQVIRTVSPEAWGRGCWLIAKYQETEVRDWRTAEQGPDVYEAEYPNSPSSLAMECGFLGWWWADTAALSAGMMSLWRDLICRSTNPWICTKTGVDIHQPSGSRVQSFCPIPKGVCDPQKVKIPGSEVSSTSIMLCSY